MTRPVCLLFIVSLLCASHILAQDVPVCSPQKQNWVRTELDKQFSDLRSYARWWSFAYHTSLAGAIVCSAGASLLIKLKSRMRAETRENWSAILAALSALLLTLLAAGGVSQKWQATRIAAFAVGNLRYELQRSSTNCDAIISQLQRIITEREQVIVQSGRGAGSPAPN
jgi:hypothetical protein